MTLFDNDIKDLEDKIKKANALYRKGEQSPYTDEEYDALLEKLQQLDPENLILMDTGSEEAIEKDRKVPLPTSMHSFTKVYVNDSKGDQLAPFLNLPGDKVWSLKYDGAALLLEYHGKRLVEAYTKGRGGVGQRSLAHALLIPGIVQDVKEMDPFKTYLIKLELVIRKSVFEAKYAPLGFKNSRNLVAGLLNKKDPMPAYDVFQDVVAKAHTLIVGGETTQLDLKKSTQLRTLEKIGFSVVQWGEQKEIGSTGDLFMAKLKSAKDGDFLVDGIVIEMDCPKERQAMGFQTNGDPKFAVAYKAQFDDAIVTTEVTKIDWNISKTGIIVPRVTYKPVQLNGTTCTAASGFNYKFIHDNSLGIGSLIKLQKGGDIIPDIVEVLSKGKMNIPKVCPSCGAKLNLTSTKVHLRCDNSACIASKIKQAISFFKIMGIENFGEALVEKYMVAQNKYEIIDILKATQNDMVVAGLGVKMSDKIQKNIKSCFSKPIALEKLMHASGIFGSALGSRKLKLIVEHFRERCIKGDITVDEIIAIKGFEDTTAYQYVNNQKEFQRWLKKLPFTPIYDLPKKLTSGPLLGNTYVFTGFRDQKLEDLITSHGGKIGSSVSSNTTALIVVSKGSGSSKETKAESLGVSIKTKYEIEKELDELQKC
jgi:DNA ligase (NAD+)